MSFIWTISPAASMVLYQASCPCVCAHAWCCECQPGSGLPFSTKRAIWVAIHNPMLPSRMAGRETVFLPRSGLSVMPCSRFLISETESLRSLFHSRAFMARSRWASNINMSGVIGEVQIQLRFPPQYCWGASYRPRFSLRYRSLLRRYRPSIH